MRGWKKKLKGGEGDKKTRMKIRRVKCPKKPRRKFQGDSGSKIKQY